MCICTEIEIVRIQLREHFKIKYAHRGDGAVHGAQQHRSADLCCYKIIFNFVRLLAQIRKAARPHNGNIWLTSEML